MAALYITEYKELATDGNGHFVQAGLEPAIVQQTPVALSATSAQSAAFNASTHFIRVFSDTACFITFGTNPTAVTATQTPIAANTAEFFAIQPGTSLKLAAVT